MSSELGSLAKGGDSFEMLSQNLPGLHLGIGEQTERIVPPDVLRAVTSLAEPEKSLNAIDGSAFIVLYEF